MGSLSTEKCAKKTPTAMLTIKKVPGKDPWAPRPGGGG